MVSRWLSIAAALLSPVDKEISPVYVSLRDHVEAALRAELDEAAFTAAWHEGEEIAADGGERAVAYALHGSNCALGQHPRLSPVRNRPQLKELEKQRRCAGRQ